MVFGFFRKKEAKRPSEHETPKKLPEAPLPITEHAIIATILEKQLGIKGNETPENYQELYAKLYGENNKLGLPLTSSQHTHKSSLPPVPPRDDPGFRARIQQERSGQMPAKKGI